MHKGVFGGKNLTPAQSILILGESHHYGKADDPEYTTERVVMNYFRRPNDKCYKFFDKIAGCFGFAPKDREMFWNQVWFGNYVAESNCGIGNSKARKLIGEHRTQYNKELFEFVNEHGIDTVFCFSRLVYNNLPDRAPFESGGFRYDVPKLHGKADFIRRFVYLSGERPKGDVSLKKPLTVYGFRHPSARCGFSVENYAPYVKKFVQF